MAEEVVDRLNMPAGEPDPGNDAWKYLSTFRYASAFQSGGSNYRSGTFYTSTMIGGLLSPHQEERPLLNDPRIAVHSTASASGLQVVQIVFAPSVPSGMIGNNRVQQMPVNGIPATAFVDGGVNSPLAHTRREDAQRTLGITSSGDMGNGMPYYYSNQNLTLAKVGGEMVWDNSTNSGAVTARDLPTSSDLHPSITFETYFVLTNYNGLGKDLVVGKIIC